MSATAKGAGNTAPTAPLKCEDLVHVVGFAQNWDGREGERAQGIIVSIKRSSAVVFWETGPCANREAPIGLQFLERAG